MAGTTPTNGLGTLKDMENDQSQDMALMVRKGEVLVVSRMCNHHVPAANPETQTAWFVDVWEKLCYVFEGLFAGMPNMHDQF